MKIGFGNFWGDLQQRVEIAGLGLSETAYAPHAHLPAHAHESAYFCLVLRGAYAESYGCWERACRPAMLLFHPAGETHSDRFGAAGGACFNLEFGAAWAARLRELSPRLTTPVAFDAAASVQLATRVRREIHLPDELSALALELLVATARRIADKEMLIAAEHAQVLIERAHEFLGALDLVVFTVLEALAERGGHLFGDLGGNIFFFERLPQPCDDGLPVCRIDLHIRRSLRQRREAAQPQQQNSL